jgi:hypothetical protein
MPFTRNAALDHGMQSPGQRQIEPLPFPQADPAQPVSLTPASQCLHPLPLDFFADPAELTAAVVQAEVLVEPAQHHRKVVLLFTFLPMPMLEQPLACSSEKFSAALGAGYSDHGKSSCPIHPTDMLETQKFKCLRPLSVLAPCSGSKATEEKQPSFVFGQLQVESRKALPQVLLEILRVFQKLEASHKIICESHQVRLALALRFEFLFKPQVEREVQIEIT